MDRAKLVQIWKQYGKTYNVFVPDDQPMTKGEGWDLPVPEVSAKGTIDTQSQSALGFHSSDPQCDSAMSATAL